MDLTISLFLVQPAPATKSNSASGRIVCWASAGARTPVTVVRFCGMGQGDGDCLDGSRAGFSLPGSNTAGIEANQPGSLSRAADTASMRWR